MSYGNNFGLNNSLEYFEFALDSADTENSGNGVSLNTDWPVFWLGRPLDNVAAIKILEVQIPFSYYVYNSTNNILYLSESNGAQGPFTITIPVGNYDKNTMSSELSSLLTAASATGTNTYTYTVTYISATQQFQIVNGGGTQFTITIGTAGDSANTNVRGELGLYGGDNVSSSGGTLIAPYAAMITGPNYIYVNSTLLGSNVQMYLPSGAVNLGNGTLGPQIAKVPVNVQPGGIIYWSDPDPQKWFDCENLNNIPRLDFYLSLGNTSSQLPLQLNGQSFSIKLGLLVNKMVHNDVLGGGSHNDRVFQRCVPRGGMTRMF